MRAIEIIVEPDGNLKIEALNFQGADCEKATQFLEEALGQLKERRRKPAYLAKARSRLEVRA